MPLEVSEEEDMLLGVWVGEGGGLIFAWERRGGGWVGLVWFGGEVIAVA